MNVTCYIQSDKARMTPKDNATQEELSQEASSNRMKIIDREDLPTNRIKPFRTTPSLFPDRQVGQFEVGLPEGDKILEIVSSSDQSMVAVGSSKGRIILYRFDEENGDQMICSSSSTPCSKSNRYGYKDPTGFEVRALAFSPNNEILAAIFFAYDKNSKLVSFSPKDGTCLGERNLSSQIFTLAFSNSSKLLAIGGKNGCHIFDVEKTKPASIISIDDNNNSEIVQLGAVKSLSFCPGDDKILVGSDDGCLLVDSKGSKVFNHINKGTCIHATAFSPDGMVYAVGTRNSDTSLHGTSTGQLINTFNHESRSIEFSKDGNRVFCNDYYSRSIYGYDVISGEKIFQSSDSLPRPSSLIENDSQMVIGCRNLAQIYNTVVSLKAKELEQVAKCDSAAVSSKGQIMAFCEGKRGISIYNSLGQKINSFQRYCYSSAFSPKGDKLAVGGCGTTTIYSIEKKRDGTGFKIEKQLQIDHEAEKGFFSRGAVVNQVIFYSEKGKERIVSVLSSFIFKTIVVVHCAEGGGGKRLHAASITIPYECSLVPIEVVPNTSHLKVWKNNQYVAYNYANDNVDDRINFNFQGDIKKASRFSPDGSKLLVVISKQLEVYEFSAEKGFNASDEDAIATIDLSCDDASAIEIISHPRKNIAAIAFDGGGIDIIAFENWKEGKASYTIATHKFVKNMFFRSIESHATITNSYQLIVTFKEDKYGIYEIRLSDINPTEPFSLLEQCTNERNFIYQCARCSNRKSIAFRRNEDGDTLLQKAYVKGYYKYVEQAVMKSPEAVLALYCIRPELIQSIEDKSIIECCAKKNELDRFGRFLLSPESLAFEPGEKTLHEIVACIESLATYNATDTLAAVLDAGANGCIRGLVPGRKVWFLEPKKYVSILNKLEIFKIFKMYRKQYTLVSPSITKNLPIVSVSNISPQTSSLIQNLQFTGYKDDNKKRIQLNLCRVLLPNLASSSILRALLNMREQYEGDSSSLKLFGKRSLRDSINAVWNSWGKQMLLWQFLLYCAWLFCITALAGIRRINEISANIDDFRICLICSVSAGWVYFTYLEVKQAMYRDMGISRYFSLSWNHQHLIRQIFVFLFVLMELVRPMGDLAIVCGALSQLFGWVNLLYYMRSIEEVAWIVYALLRLIKSMANFLSILFLVMFSCALFFWSLELPSQFERFDDIFMKIIFTSLFGDFDLDHDLVNSRFKTFTFLFNLVILLMIPLICLNAMIAFISETFADILDDKIAVIAREKANLIMDLYCGMRKKRREDLEEKNAWTFKLELQSTLDKVDRSEDVEVANKRSTKGDIAGLRIKADEGLLNLKSAIKEETANKMKASTKEMKGEMEEIRIETKEMKGKMEEMTGEAKELKGKLEKMESQMEEMRAKTTLILQLLQQQ